MPDQILVFPYRVHHVKIESVPDYSFSHWLLQSAHFRSASLNSWICPFCGDNDHLLQPTQFINLPDLDNSLLAFSVSYCPTVDEFFFVPFNVDRSTLKLSSLLKLWGV